MTQSKVVYKGSCDDLKDAVEDLLDDLFYEDDSTHEDRRDTACEFVNKHFDER